MDAIKRLGQEVCERYFNAIQNDSPNLLEEIIAEIAKREELNPHEIARVCQYANTRIFLKLFNTVSDKTIEFPVADPRRVTERVGGGVVISDSSDDVMGDEWYTLEEEPPPLVLEENRIPLDYKELIHHLNQLDDSIDDIEVAMHEQYPQLVRDLSSRIIHEGPKAVIIAVKSVGGPESLLKAAFARAGVPYDDSDFDLNHYLVNDQDPLLQKVASYGRMCATIGKLKEMRGKVASVVSAITRNPLRVMMAVGELSSASQKTKNLKDRMLTQDELPNKFRVKNAPRASQPGLRGYVKSY